MLNNLSVGNTKQIVIGYFVTTERTGTHGEHKITLTENSMLFLIHHVDALLSHGFKCTAQSV